MGVEGITIPKWGGRRAVEALRQVKAEGRRRRTPCCECHQRIDYDLPSTDPRGCTVQHIRSRKVFPELTWVPSNWAPCHKECNESAGAGESPEETGVTSRRW